VLSICGNSFKTVGKAFQVTAMLSSRQSVATLKTLKYKIYFDLFNPFLVTTGFHMCYFIVLMSSLLFYNVEKKQSRKNILMSRCVQTFDWYCIYELIHLGTVDSVLDLRVQNGLPA
jgi:hypothetical protein